MAHNCNLAIEFNGLVSKGVNRKIDPYYIQDISRKKTIESNLIDVVFYCMFLLKHIFHHHHCSNILIMQVQSI